MNASLSAVVSTLSSILSFVAMALFSLWIACVVSGWAVPRPKHHQDQLQLHEQHETNNRQP